MKTIMKITVSVLAIILLAVTYQPASGQFIYYSNCPGICELDYCTVPRDTAFIFVHAPDESDIVGAHFRLETDIIDPGDKLSIFPEPGVIIETGDIFSGMAISMKPVSLNHIAVIKIVIHSEQRLSPSEGIWDHWIREAALFTFSGDTLFLDDCWTFPGHFDCWDATFGCWHSDTVDVVIDALSIVEIRCWISLPGYGGTNFEVSDEMKWVKDWDPKAVWHDGCGVCRWEEEVTLISVFVPNTTPKQTISRISIRPTHHGLLPDSTFFFLKAVPPVATENSTWGQIKSIHRKNE